MARSKSVLKWCFRVIRREDYALQRFQSLEACRKTDLRVAVPVFLARKAV